MSDSEGTPAHDGEEPEERRRFAWWWLGLILLLLIGVCSLCSDGADEDAGEPAAAPTTATTTLATAPATQPPAATEPPATEPPATLPPGEEWQLEGVWEVTVKVSETSGACVGEENEPAYASEVVVTQVGENTYEVTGLGSPGTEPWEGRVADGRFVFNGQRAEDDGVTTASFTMERSGEGLIGVEDWSWDSEGLGTCPTGRSEVVATYLGPLGS